MTEAERKVLEAKFTDLLPEITLVSIGNAKQVLNKKGELLAYMMYGADGSPYLKPSLWKG